MNCVTTDCPNEAKKGENHCVSHEKKPELVLQPTYADIAQGSAIGILTNMPTHLDFQKLEAIEPPGPAITLSTLNAIGITNMLQHRMLEMMDTGLYGDGYDQFVREAVCAYVREYVKGKK